jgi:hypothetical protein
MANEQVILMVGAKFDPSAFFKYDVEFKLPSSMTYSPVTVYHKVLTLTGLVDPYGKFVLLGGVAFDFVTLEELLTDNSLLLRFVDAGSEVLTLKIKKTTVTGWILEGRVTASGVVDMLKGG